MGHTRSWAPAENAGALRVAGPWRALQASQTAQILPRVGPAGHRTHSEREARSAPISGCRRGKATLEGSGAKPLVSDRKRSPDGKGPCPPPTGLLATELDWLMANLGLKKKKRKKKRKPRTKFHCVKTHTDTSRWQGPCGRRVLFPEGTPREGSAPALQEETLGSLVACVAGAGVVTGCLGTGG